VARGPSPTETLLPMSLYDSPNQPNTNKNLLLAVVLCGLILLVSDFLTQRYLGHHLLGSPVKPVAEATAVANMPEAVVAAAVAVSPSAPLPQPVRLPLSNDRVAGQINLQGGSLDALTLKTYRTEIKENGGYAMLAPAANSPTTAEYLVAGWQGAGIEGPSANSVWQREADQSTANALTMVWRNGTGQAFQRTWQLRPNSYLWQVTERVVNTAALPVSLTPYAQVVRHGGYTKEERSNFVNYFGPMGQLKVGEDLLLKEEGFKDVKKAGQSEVWQGTGGWWGITSQYFAAAVIPAANTPSSRQFAFRTEGTQEVYTAGVQFAPLALAANGGTGEISYLVYAGPKHYDMLKEAGAGLEQAISWGWFEPLVKGLYYVLTLLQGCFAGFGLASWGVAVIALTLLLKIATFPLANTSYRAMAKMKKLQPEVEALKKKHGEDQQAMAMAMMALYKEKKVNPMSGCWPMLIQIPIFFAMYKVVLVMFEFRHAPFLYMSDLAVYDPFYILPILMGASMWVQFKLNPTPTDPVQEMVFKWMPLMMTVMFLWFPAGLVLYWFTNNLLSIAQQAWMMRQEKAL
jgi:YidC/Oxa1 family membrane protein insertase